MRALRFHTVQVAYDPENKSPHVRRDWIIHVADANLLRAEVKQAKVFAGKHTLPPYAEAHDEEYIRFLIVINANHFWFKRYKSHLAPQWIYHHKTSEYVPYTDSYFTPNDSDLFYLYCASASLLAQQLSLVKPVKGTSFRVSLKTPVLCPYPHVTHAVKGRCSDKALVPALLHGLDYGGKEVWRTQITVSGRYPKQAVTTVEEGFLFQRVMQGYGDPAKPEGFHYFITRTKLRLPARRTVKQYTTWQGKPLLRVVEGFEKDRFTRLEFSDYATVDVNKGLFRLDEKPNLDAAKASAITPRPKAIRPPYVEPPPEAFLKDPGEREGLKRVRNNPQEQTYRAAFERFQFEQTLVLALMENIMLWQHGYSLLP
ncbi:MAG: hypothetical protein KatS3mg022_2590 [Armatimonadota bacterium]|nr:MAG: hypothetical protein KatS3mg022_2590 [Armatimonadota bacterium]